MFYLKSLTPEEGAALVAKLQRIPLRQWKRHYRPGWWGEGWVTRLQNAEMQTSVCVFVGGQVQVDVDGIWQDLHGVAYAVAKDLFTEVERKTARAEKQRAVRCKARERRLEAQKETAVRTLLLS